MVAISELSGQLIIMLIVIIFDNSLVVNKKLYFLLWEKGMHFLSLSLNKVLNLFGLIYCLRLWVWEEVKVICYVQQVNCFFSVGFLFWA